MDLRRLNYVVALADTLYFAHAAQAVHLSQPAFSQSIQMIEDDLGIRLFDHETGDACPTPAGKFIIERVRHLLFEARCLRHDADLYRDSQLSDTAFGVGPLLMITLMPQALQDLWQQYLQVTLRMEVGNRVQLLESLRSENIEFFAVDVCDIPKDTALDIQLIGGQPPHLYMRAGHPPAGCTHTLREIWEHGTAVPKLLSPSKVELAMPLGLPAGQEASIALEYDNYGVLKTVALTTDTMLGAADVVVGEELESGTLVRLAMRGWPSPPSTTGIVRLYGRTASPAARAAVAVIVRAAQGINV